MSESLAQRRPWLFYLYYAAVLVLLLGIRLWDLARATVRKRRAAAERARPGRTVATAAAPVASCPES